LKAHCPIALFLVHIGKNIGWFIFTFSEIWIRMSRWSFDSRVSYYSWIWVYLS